AVDVGLSVWRGQNRPDILHPGRVRRHELFPQSPHSGIDVQLIDFGGKVARPVNIEAIGIRSPAHRDFSIVETLDRTRLARGNRVKVTLAVRTDRRNHTSIWR